MSRNSEYDTGLKVIETELLKEEEGKLKLNPNARIAMVHVKMDDQELFEEIKKESGGKFENFQGVIKIPKNMERRIISRFHDNAKEGHQGLARTMEKIQNDFYIPGNKKNQEIHQRV